MLLLSMDGKKMQFSSFEQIQKRLGLTEPLSDEEMKYIKKRSNKGDVTYAAYDPYDSEMNGYTSLLIGDDEEEVRERRYQRAMDV